MYTINVTFWLYDIEYIFSGHYHYTRENNLRESSDCQLIFRKLLTLLVKTIVTFITMHNGLVHANISLVFIS